MALEQFQSLLPIYLVALVRVSGMVALAPVVGHRFVPFRVKAIVALALTLGILPAIGHVPAIPGNSYLLVAGLGAELIFGMAMGLCANFVFVAARWAGEMIGQQMGFTLSGVIDPQAGVQSSVVGDFYLVFTLVIFLLTNGHHVLVRAVAGSFTAVPLLGAVLGANFFGAVVAMLGSATLLAMQLAAPLLVTMLIVDLSIGVMSRVVPQMNVLAMSLSVRSAVGLLVLLLIVALTASTLGTTTNNWMKLLPLLWKGSAGG